VNIERGTDRTFEPEIDMTKKRKDLPVAQIDLGILRRLGYCKPGELKGDELGWPPSWIQHEGRRLYFLIDRRVVGRECALFIIEDGNQQPRAQFFWLREGTSGFGRRQWFFWDPACDSVSDRLRYGHSGFRYHNAEQPNGDDWDLERATTEAETWMARPTPDAGYEPNQIKIRPRRDRTRAVARPT
jgi:hypothetical protein